MFDLKKVVERVREGSYVSNVPKVIIEEEKKQLISEWLKDKCNEEIDCSYALGMMFYKLGFNLEDMIYINDISCDNNNGVWFYYSVNSKKRNENNFIYFYDKKHYKYFDNSFTANIVISDDERNRIWCDCYWNNEDNISFKIYEYEEPCKRREDNIRKDCYYRKFYKKHRKNILLFGYMGYDINNLDYRIELSVEIDDNDIMDSYYYELENEELLKWYLKNLECPISIIDVYKDLCEILVNGNRYPKVNFKVIKCGKKYFEKVTDMFDLYYGILRELTITKDNKTVTIGDFNKWSYTENFGCGDFSISSKDGVKVNFNADDEVTMIDFLDNFDKKNIDIAKEEVAKVRKLVKDNFNRRMIIE